MCIRDRLESFYQHEAGKFSAFDKLDRIDLETQVEKLQKKYRKVLDLAWDGNVVIILDGLANLLAFILDRLKVYLRDQGIRHDIIDAALSNGEDDLVAIVNRVNALQDFLGTEAGENLLAGYKRCLLYTSPSPRDGLLSRMPSSA